LALSQIKNAGLKQMITDQNKISETRTNLRRFVFF